MKYCNQFTIKIDKTVAWCDYIQLIEACRELNGVALKLYIYLTAFEPDTDINFFPKNFCDTVNVSMASEKNAFKELLEKNFLKQVSTEYYIFYSKKIDRGPDKIS